MSDEGPVTGRHMAKSLLFRLFGVGKLPRRVRSSLEAEGIRTVDEGIGGSVTYRDFKTPRKRFGWRRVWFTGSVAATRKRFVACAFGREVVNIPYDDPRLKKMSAQVEPGSVLVVAFAAQDFQSAMSGRVEMRFRTEKAREFTRCFREGA